MLNNTSTARDKAISIWSLMSPCTKFDDALGVNLAEEVYALGS